MFSARLPALLILLALAGAWFTGCGETTENPETLPDLPSNNAFTLQLVTANLAFPVFMTTAPGDNTRLFIVERGGTIRIFTGGALLSTPFLNITGLVRTVGGEEGLLGMAFDAQYAANRQLYVFYTDVNGDIVIARYLRNALNANVADPGGTTLLTVEHSANSNHNGGMLAFGTDDCLYASVGDGGGSGDQSNNAQTVASRLGKILRLNPYTGSTCNIATNPFFLIAPEVWSLGLRNPWRFSFDRVTNDLYIADVGQGAREEINVSPAPSAGRGLNYGWRFMEGFLCFNPDTNCNQGGLTLPVLDYPHADGACSVTGGYVYRGQAAPAQRGTYFYADFCNGFVRSFRYQNGQATDQFKWPLLSRQGITSFGEDAQGELYLMTQGGSLFKIVPN